MTIAPQRERHRETVARLATAQKSGKGAPAYSRFVNRRAGRHLAAVAYRLGLTPNGVTAISGLFTFASIALIALVQPRWWLGVVVFAGLSLGYALDAADGQLARLRGGGSKAGEWLDHMLDSAKISSLHLAVLIGLYRFADFDHVAWLLVPIGFTLVNNVLFFAMLLNDSLRRITSGPPAPPTSDREAGTLRSLLAIPTDYGVFCLSFLILGSSAVFLGVYTFLFAGSAGYLLLGSVKWFRDMRALDAR